jgi:membrane-associated phospholipid phosphatase
MTTTRSAAANAIAGIVLFAIFFALGGYVVPHGEPSALWTFAQAVRGHAIGLAWAFTNAGWAQVLAPLYAICLIVAIVSKRWRVRALYVIAVALICWGLADGFQHFFARPRRDDWLIRHEHAFSYPSSHAAISTGFYFLWGWVLLRSELPRWIRFASFIILTAFTLGIVWSRLALGAHYPTDVCGGIMLGLAVSLLAAAAVKVLAAPGAAT